MILMQCNTNDNTPSKCDMHTCTHVFAFCVCTDWISSLLKNIFLALSLSLSKKKHIVYLYYKQFVTFIILAECRATTVQLPSTCATEVSAFFFSADGLFLKPLSTTQVTPTWIKQPYASHVWIRFSSHTCSFRLFGIAVNICSARISVLVLDGSWRYLDISPCLKTKSGPQIYANHGRSEEDLRITGLHCTIEFAPLGGLDCNYYYYYYYYCYSSPTIQHAI